jgi:antitoxin ParD1/3/4
MGNVRKISVALTAEQIAALQVAVETGEYATTSEIIREALRDWQSKRELRREEIDRLRRLWQQGIVSGRGKLGGIDQVKAEARRRRVAVKRASSGG